MAELDHPVPKFEDLKSRVHLVIMAGGSGTRFWPKSTSRKPKQLLLFFDREKTLLRQTLDRFEAIVSRQNVIVVTTRILEEQVRAELPGIEILAEPQGRNTAPCIFWAAQVIKARHPNALMVVMPSDHFIVDLNSFLSTVKRACERASSQNELVTLAVKPTRPETGYGYLLLGETKEEGVHNVDAFVEKPNYDRAVSFLKSGKYFWNGGMFIWSVASIVEAFEKFMPELGQAWERSGRNVQAAYPNMTATSVDFGVMEKAKNVVGFPIECGWDDLGNWTSLEDLAPKLGFGKSCGVVMNGETIDLDSVGNIVDLPGKRIALLGVQNMIIVENEGVLLVADKKRSQDIRRLVEEVKKVWPEKA